MQAYVGEYDGTIKSWPLLRYSLSALWFTYWGFFISCFPQGSCDKINPIRAPLRLCCILMLAVPQDLSQLFWNQTWVWSAGGNALTEAICSCSTAILMLRMFVEGEVEVSSLPLIFPTCCCLSVHLSSHLTLFSSVTFFVNPVFQELDRKLAQTSSDKLIRRSSNRKLEGHLDLTSVLRLWTQCFISK